MEIWQNLEQIKRVTDHDFPPHFQNVGSENNKQNQLTVGRSVKYGTRNPKVTGPIPGNSQSLYIKKILFFQILCFSNQIKCFQNIFAISNFIFV